MSYGIFSVKNAKIALEVNSRDHMSSKSDHFYRRNHNAIKLYHIPIVFQLLRGHTDTHTDEQAQDNAPLHRFAGARVKSPYARLHNDKLLQRQESS